MWKHIILSVRHDNRINFRVRSENDGTLSYYVGVVKMILQSLRKLSLNCYRLSGFQQEIDEDTLRKVGKYVLNKSLLTTGKSFVSESGGRWRLLD